MANTDVTISQVDILSLQEKAAGFTHKWTIAYTDVDEGTGTTDTVTAALGNTPSNFIVAKVAANVTTAFAGTGAFTMEVGTDGDPNNFIESTSVKSAGTILAAAGAAPATLAGSHAQAADALEVVFTNATSGSPSALTAGSVDIYMQLIELA
jgi:hypothetical protein